MPKLIAALLLFVLCLHANADDCAPMATQLAGKLGYPGIEAEGYRFFVECKVSPENPETTIVVFAHGKKQAFMDPPDGVFDLEVLLVNSGSGDVLQHLAQAAAFTSDAISLSSIRIDTANYILAKGVRAFGVRASRENQSRIAGYASEVINMYIVKDNHLRKIIGNLLVSENSSDSECEGGGQYTTGTLMVANTVTNGLADLILTKRRKEFDGDIHSAKCEMHKSSTSAKYLLKFDGKTYSVPDNLIWKDD